MRLVRTIAAIVRGGELFLAEFQGNRFQGLRIGNVGHGEAARDLMTLN